VVCPLPLSLKAYAQTMTDPQIPGPAEMDHRLQLIGELAPEELEQLYAALVEAVTPRQWDRACLTAGLFPPTRAGAAERVELRSPVL
jgi:hypothetical protein